MFAPGTPSQQMPESLCASSPTLFSPTDYQSPLDSTHSPPLLRHNVFKRRSMRVRPACFCIASVCFRIAHACFLIAHSCLRIASSRVVHYYAIFFAPFEITLLMKIYISQQAKLSSVKSFCNSCNRYEFYMCSLQEVGFSCWF